jgi:hypothetical protein
MIKLNSSVINKPVYIFVEHVSAIMPGITGAQINMADGTTFSVKETPEEVVAMIEAYGDILLRDLDGDVPN